jgi:hypothetical protein
MLLASTRKFLFFLSALVLGWTASGRADETEAPSRDVLVFKDGDRVQGRLVEQKDMIIVFRSDRFGDLRVPVGAAVVIRAEKPPEPAPVAAAGETAAVPAVVPVATEKPPTVADRAEAEKVSRWEHFSSAVLTAGLRNVFGSWHGRVAISTEVVSDTADRNNLSLDAKLKRKWKADEVQLNGRYDFNRTDNLTTTDMIKGDGQWRHEFSKRSFAQYRPSLEWNRASFKNKVPTDYVLLQQEIGAGVSLLTTPARKVRVGVSENLFDVWNTTPAATHNSRAVESAFLETELKMPWSMLLTDRGVYYYSFTSRNDGWENRVELTKKFTETLSTAIRHETRQGSPDGKAQDYTRLKLLFGLDF